MDTNGNQWKVNPIPSEIIWTMASLCFTGLSLIKTAQEWNVSHLYTRAIVSFPSFPVQNIIKYEKVIFVEVSNRPFQIGIFPEINHPAMGVASKKWSKPPWPSGHPTPPTPWRSIPRRRDPCSVRSRGSRSWGSPRRARTARHRSGSCTYGIRPYHPTVSYGQEMSGVVIFHDFPPKQKPAMVLSQMSRIAMVFGQFPQFTEFTDERSDRHLGCCSPHSIHEGPDTGPDTAGPFFVVSKSWEWIGPFIKFPWLVDG